MSHHPPLAFEAFAHVLRFVHLAIAVALLVTLLLLARAQWRGGNATRLVRLSAALYVAAFALGLVIYPTYRINIRALHLDREAVWAANLFDMKEHLAALGMAAALGLLFTGPGPTPVAERTLGGIALCTALLSAAGGFVVALVRGL